MKVSIITPSLNSEKTIEQTINSVLNQRYTDFEYIIIDGNSSDHTVDIIKEYISLFGGRMRYISEKDDGIYDAMNKGIKLARGNVIGIINSDDWYEKDALEKVVNFFSNNDTDVIYGKMNILTENAQLEEYPVCDLSALWYKMVIPHPTVFVRREIYKRYGVFNTQYNLSADYELMLRFYSQNVKFSFVDSVLANFRLGGESQHNRIHCIKEGYDISFHYIDKCPVKKTVFPILKEEYSYFFLEQLLLENPEAVLQKICNYFATELYEVILFGTGFWGEKFDNAFSEMRIKVKYFLANNRSKGCLSRNDITIFLPNEIKELDDHIIIAVRKQDNEIKNQLKQLGLKNMITLCEIVKLVSDLQ